jgi:hypothetical protein
MQEGGSFTATPAGLVYIVGEIALIIKEEDEVLPKLNSPHFFHCSIWHQENLFVISGENNKKVEKFDFKERFWINCPSLPEDRQEAAVCSSGMSLFLMGGGKNGVISRDIFKFDEDWVKLKVALPVLLKNLGVIFDRDRFILFAGESENTLNDRYFVFDLEFNHLETGELLVKGKFSRKAFGYLNGVYSFVFSEKHALEYKDGFFSQVNIGVN